ncbi:MAG: PAS domain S-box protein [Nitrospira sp.]|nr:PAS domain S-box protein [Nitrospira sp.]
MKRESNQSTNRIVIGLTLFLFVANYSLIVLAGVSDARHLFNLLIASYLVLWGGYALTSSVPRAEIRSQFLLVTFSLGLALLLVEVPAWLKLVDYRKTFSISSSLPWEQPGYLPDPELLAKPEPYHSVKMLFNLGNIGTTLCLPPRQAEPFELKYDRNGFRNDSDLANAEIAVIGDSYVESPMLPSSMLATTRLAELTQRTVVNLGQSGYGPQQELAVLKRYGLPLHPKAVVWVFFEGNDLLDADEYTGMVSFLKSNWNTIDTAWNRSFTRNALFSLTKAVRGCVPVEAARERTAHATVMDTEGRKHWLYIKGRSQSASLTKGELDTLKASVAVIEEAYRLVKNEGARFVVAFAPTAFRVYYDIANFKEAEEDITRWELNDLSDRLRKMISEISPDIEYLDLTPALKSAARKNVLVFLPDDTHWSGEGHQVVAEILSHALADGTRIYAENPSPDPEKPMEDGILSTEAIMVRNLDGTIRYWSKGAQKLYGWEPRDALGTTSHQLLKTVFPVPLEVIEEELRTKGRWEGQLIHVRRDGSKVTVASHWDLQQNPRFQDRSATVVEVNGPLPISSSGSFRKELLSLLKQSNCLNGPPLCRKVS